MRRARHLDFAECFSLAQGVHRPRRPQPCPDRTRLSTHPKQAGYSTDYASICGTNIMRGTTKRCHPTLDPCKETICNGLYDCEDIPANEGVYCGPPPEPQ